MIDDEEENVILSEVRESTGNLNEKDQGPNHSCLNNSSFQQMLSYKSKGRGMKGLKDKGETVA